MLRLDPSIECRPAHLLLFSQGAIIAVIIVIIFLFSRSFLLFFFPVLFAASNTHYRALMVPLHTEEALQLLELSGHCALSPQRGRFNPFGEPLKRISSRVLTLKKNQTNKQTKNTHLGMSCGAIPWAVPEALSDDKEEPHLLV